MKLRWQFPLRRKSNFSLLPQTEGNHTLSSPSSGNASGGEYSPGRAASDITIAGSTFKTRSNGLQPLPRPAIRWVGTDRRIALRPFDFTADADAVCAFQEETYSNNFPGF